MVFEDRIPSRSVAGLPGKVVQGRRDDPVDHGLVVVLAHIPGVADGIDDTVLIDRIGVVDPDNPAREDSFGHPHRLVRINRGRCDRLLRATCG